MRKNVYILTLFLCLSVGLTSCQEASVADNKTFEQAIFEAEKAAQTAEPAEEASIWADILRKYPENQRFVQIVNRYLTLVIENKLGYENAIALLEEIKPRVEDEQNLVHIDYSKANLLSWLERYEESAALYLSVSERASYENRSLKALQYAFRNAVRAGDNVLADELENKIKSLERLGYSAHINFMSEFIKAEKWQAALHQIECALKTSSPEALQEESPDSTQKYFENASEFMQQSIRPYYALVLFNLGRRDEAMQHFELADAEGWETVFGVRYSPTTLNFGRALLELGKTGAAIDKLLLPAVIMREPDALEALKEAYIANGGAVSGFENYVLQQRDRLTIAAPDFTLDTLDGGKRSLSDFRGKVVLLNFFTPT